MNENICCKECGLVMQDDSSAHKIYCPRCNAKVRKTSLPIAYDLGLSIAAMILFLPAMIFPVISFKIAGIDQVNYMFSSFSYFVKDGYPELGVLVIFITIVVPFLQIFFSLLIFIGLYENRKPKFMKFYFWVLNRIRSWVMLEVYLIAILVSCVKLTQKSEIIYETGLVFLVALAVFSFLLKKSFSPKKIWRAYDDAY